MKQIIYLVFMVVFVVGSAYAADPPPKNINTLDVLQTVETTDYFLISDQSAQGTAVRYPVSNHDAKFLSKTNTEPYTPTQDYHPVTLKYFLDNVSSGGGDAMLDVINTWPAKQIFAGGAEASLSGANFLSWNDLKYNGQKIVDANATLGDVDKLLPASKTHELINDLRDEMSAIVSSGRATLEAMPYSDVACTADGIFNSIYYFCHQGHYTLQQTLSVFDNPLGAVPTGTFDTYQNFEGLGVDNGETWDIFGTPNFDYAGADVIAGSQSLQLDFSGALETAKKEFTPASVKYIHFRARARYTGDGYGMFFIYAADNEQIAKITINTSSISLLAGTFGTGADYTVVEGQILHFWLKQNATTKTGDLYIGSTITRPSTPIVTSINGNNVGTVMSRMEFKGLGYKGAGTAWYFDQVISSDTEFTTVPELP